MSQPECFLRQFSTKPCYGRLVRAHLIPQQTLKKEIAYVNTAILWDERVWAWACGGVVGDGGHHGELDQKKIIIPYLDLPFTLLEYAHEHGLMWWIERHFPTISLEGGCSSSE